jgi:hypothetical protein
MVEAKGPATKPYCSRLGLSSLPLAELALFKLLINARLLTTAAIYGSATPFLKPIGFERKLRLQPNEVFDWCCHKPV